MRFAYTLKSLRTQDFRKSEHCGYDIGMSTRDQARKGRDNYYKRRNGHCHSSICASAKESNEKETDKRQMGITLEPCTDSAATCLDKHTKIEAIRRSCPAAADKFQGSMRFLCSLENSELLNCDIVY